jgi:putative peptidoglycan lipid II flippase
MSPTRAQVWNRLRATFGQQRLLGGALVLAVTQFGASLVGLVRDNLLNRTFPKLGVVDAYIAAFRPSDLLFQVCIMSALGTVLVPLLAAHKAHKRTDDASQVLAGTMAMGGLLFGVVGLILAVFLPQIAPLLVQFQGEQLHYYIQFTRIALVVNFLFVFGNSFGQFLVVEQKYWVYGLTPILYTLGTIAGTLWLTPVFGPYGPILGTAAGALLYTIWRFIGVWRCGFRIRSLRWHPDLHEMGLLMLPRMLALGALQMQLLLFDTIASGIGTGSVTVNYAARNFQGVIVGVAGIALSQSAFSLLGQTAAKGEMTRFRLYVEKGLKMILLFTIPASVLLVLCAPIAVRLVHLQNVMGTFTLCLILYAISVPFESAAHLLLRAFYSLKDTVIPAVLAVASGLGAIAIGWAFAKNYGVLSLPLGYTVGQAAETMILGWLLLRKVRRMGGTGSGSAADLE